MRYALRVLARTPAFWLTALTTLALAIGVNTAVFIPVRAGRVFDSRDCEGSPPVVVGSDALVRTRFKDANPIGRRIRLSGTVREIVGIVGDVQVKPGTVSSGSSTDGSCPPSSFDRRYPTPTRAAPFDPPSLPSTRFCPSRR